jgi:hypothetical protein
MNNYCYGSGHLGCLFDFGPHFTDNRSIEDKKMAIKSLMFVFPNLSESEKNKMKQNLMNDGIHYFSNPTEVGADYAEINEHSMSKQEYNEYLNECS